MELLVIRSDKQIGPFSQEQLVSMIEAGMIDPTDLAWHEGLAEWTPLNQIFDLSPPATEPEAPQPEEQVAAPDPEPPPEEPVPEAAVVTSQRPRPPAGFLAPRPVQPVQPAQAVQPVQPVRAARPVAQGAVPVARPQQPRAAVPICAGAPVAARPAARAGVPERGAVPAAVPGFGAKFLHTGQPGSFGARLMAFLIDVILVGIAGSIIAWPLSFLLGGGIQLPPQGGRMSEQEALAMTMKILAMSSRVIIFQIIVMWLYYALMESSAKQGTLGKKWCGLMVTNMDGNRIGFGRATGRFFGKYLSALLLYIGFLMCLWTEKKQCLHDIMAGTQVLKRGL